MPKNLIDRPGAFRGNLLQWAVNETRNGNPQFVAEFAGLEYYVEGADELAAFEMTEPGWINWADYDQSILGYLVLFNDKGPLLNYEQLQKALGWDGASFASLAQGDWSGKQLLFRVDWHEYDGKTSLQVQWVDAYDADPVRSLRALDANGLKDLDSKFGGMMSSGKAKAAPARVAGTPTPPTATKPKPAAAPAKPAATKPAAAPAKPASGPPAVTKPAVQEVREEIDSVLDGCTREEAWAIVNKNCSAAGDNAIGEAWVKVATAIAEERGIDEDSFTPADWGRVRDGVTTELNAVSA